MSKVALVGAGSMGCAIAAHLGWLDNEVIMWSPVKEEIEMLIEHREHLTRLQGVRLPDNVKYTSDISECVNNADFVVLAVPSQTTRQNCKTIKPLIKESAIVITCSKGIEEQTGLLLTEIMEEELPGVSVGALSGPSHAEEIAVKMPTTVVAASKSIDVAVAMQNLFMSDTFRVYTNTDVLGVELGAALKNVIALCAGISDGIGYGDNTKAALMTRGMTEIARLGCALGAKIETFFGLTGMGDLIVTCTSMHSRNRRAGILIGQGVPVDEALKEVNMVVEGYATALPAKNLAQKAGVEMPIVEKLCAVLFEGADPKAAVTALMTRNRKSE